jgi:DNA mismatch repair protein MutS
MQQVAAIYDELPKDWGENLVIAFRLGDFYEFFGTHAELAAQTLNLTLTKRNEIAMAGVPYHLKDSSIDTLRDAGIAVVVVESKAGRTPTRGITEVHKVENGNMG